MGCRRLAQAMSCSWLVPNKESHSLNAILFQVLCTSHLANSSRRRLSLLSCIADGKRSLTLHMCNLLCCHQHCVFTPVLTCKEPLYFVNQTSSNRSSCHLFPCVSNRPSQVEFCNMAHTFWLQVCAVVSLAVYVHLRRPAVCY